MAEMIDILHLKNEFRRIRDLGWVKSVNEGPGSIGLTFEKLLGKEKENFELPDYLGIELKTHNRYSKSYTTLFNATPDGKYLFEIKRLQEMYGYPDRILKDCKVFQGEIQSNRRVKMGCFYEYQLEINRLDQRVYLCIYKKNTLVDKQTFWSFDWLQEKFERKLSLLAFVEAEKKVVKGQEYFRYLFMKIYHLRSFEHFLQALEDGAIIVSFTVGVFRNGKRKGEIHDHGTAFRIYNYDFWRLFDKV